MFIGPRIKEKLVTSIYMEYPTCELSNCFVTSSKANTRHFDLKFSHFISCFARCKKHHST